MKQYQICTRCIMDTSDPEITFDENGVCNHCHNFDVNIKPTWRPDETGKEMLEKIVEKIKRESQKNEYEAIIGLSGGVDSSYLAYVAVKQLGLRVLPVHIDGGWNSEIAVRNIENVCKSLGLDLHTYVVDWDEMNDLQAAFVRSGLANLDVPQDHAFYAGVYKFAADNNIRYVLSGSNWATEGILPPAWGYMAKDRRHLEGVHERFGKMKLKTFPRISMLERKLYYPYIKGIKVVTVLDYMPYNKQDAMKVLETLGWRYYGGKHFESRFTKFFQAYYLPTKFGYDKRRAHLSSLVVSGQMTREQALAEMETEQYQPDELREDREYVLRKLDMSEEEFEAILKAPNRTFRDYPSSHEYLEVFRKIRSFFRKFM
ncbi:MAG: N-acetyl sugar amidotransferase [Sporomusaceae bacterium]|nr:N-acetyl sugar amidotransferase [Sporomusaceae bacterium]